MPRLVALAVPPRLLVPLLEDAWDHGDAVLPLDPRLPRPARDRLLEALRPEVLVEGTTAGGHPEVVDLPDPLPVDDGDALVVATSGTTGEPRGAVLTHEAVLAAAGATSRALGVDPARDRWLSCLPLAHVGGLGVVTRALLTGTPLDVLDGFDAATVDAAGRAGATLVSLVPTALARIDPTGFRIVLLGGSAPPRVRPSNVVATYGMTETYGGIVYDGRPLDGVVVREVDGELWLRSPTLLRCYRDGSDPRDRDGWFATGDAGRVLADGTVEVDGRIGDLIVTGGENVWPAPVEEVLARLPGVEEVRVHGEQDDEWGSRVVATVVPADPSDPPTLEHLRAAAKEELPAYAAPRELVLVERLPRTPLGKLRRPPARG